MKFIRFENRLINLEAIASICFEDDRIDEPEIWLNYIAGDFLHIEGDRAITLWALLSETIAADSVSDRFAQMAADAIVSGFGRNGGGDAQPS